MKKRILFFCIIIILLIYTGFFMSCSQASKGEIDYPEDAIISNEIGIHNGYTYEFWKDDGTGYGWMLLGDGSAYQVEWKNINNLLARIGDRTGRIALNVNYTVDYQPNGNSYMCVYGWTQNDLIEYYVIDSWGTWRPPVGAAPGSTREDEYQGTFTAGDGSLYDIYKTVRTNMPSIEGDSTTFNQYWSVRQSKRTSGTVDISEHFDQWNSIDGMQLGSSLYEVSFCIEGYQSSGTAEVTELTFESDSL